jgi:hypothetical protein
LRLFAYQFESAFQSLDMSFCLPKVLLECLLELRVMGSLGHLGQCLYQLHLGVQQILQVLNK